MDWKEWIATKYLDWRGDKIGIGGSVSAYSRYVGVKQQVMNSWLNEGKKPESAKNINALVAHYGGEVYDVLGITPADAFETAVNDMTSELIGMIRLLTPEERRMVRDQLHKLTEKRGEYNRDQEDDRVE